MKQCRLCGEEKPFDQFHHRPDSPDGYRSECKGCHYQRARARATNDPTTTAARQSAWYQRNRERMLERMHQWRDTNLERKRDMDRAYAASHREEAKQRAREWNRLNPERRRVTNADVNGRARARKAGAAVIGHVDLGAIYDRDKGLCWLCGLPVVWDEASPDHVTPLSRGGGHTYTNIRLSHKRCNVLRNARVRKGITGA